MIHKFSALFMAGIIVTTLAGCGVSATVTAPPIVTSQPAIQPTTPATPTVQETVPATEAAPSGGLPVKGGANQAEAISADNIDRLNAFFQIPSTAIMTALSFSPDGKLLAAASFDGGALYDVENQKQVGTFAQQIPLVSAQWSPDGKLVAGIPGDPTKGRIVLWDVAGNKEADLLKDKLIGQNAFAFSPDGTQAVSGGASGIVTVWDLASGQPVTTINVADTDADMSAGKPQIDSLVFAGDGKTLIINVHGAISETLRWDLAANKALPKLSPANHIAAPVATALFAPGDASHVYWLSRGSVIVVDIASDKETGRLDTEDFIQSSAFSPDGKLLAVGSAGTINGQISPLIKLWDTTTGKEVKVLTGFTQIPTALAFSPDGTRLVMGISGEGIAVWGIVQNK